ncbi:response regulator transcription factor [Sphingoaurantiacus capsulatus]|uniref:Response regulator transcription factor n=1 Tax=Sphingoaurantiacus capsulatus TaxID=1771310 RepID=A0ABV7XE02_9SPHN
MSRGRIFVVDDDAAVRQATCWALRAAGYDARDFDSGEAFLRDADVAGPGCAVLDLNMPGLSGLDVLQRLRERTSPLRIIMLTGYGDVPTAVRAIQAGAADFIEKPYDPDALVAAIDRAMEQPGGPTVVPLQAAADRRGDAARERLRQLSPRQRQVLQGLVAGHPNKIIAQDLGVSPRTIEMHRADMMDRLGVANLSEALRLAYDAGMAGERRASASARFGGRRASDPRH